MKILQVIPYFTPKKGGDVNVCNNLSRELIKRGHEVTLITTDFGFDEEYVKDIENEGVEVKTFHCIFSVCNFFVSLGMKKWLKNNINNFDIIHLHDIRTYQNILIHNQSKKYDIPYVVHGHGCIPTSTGKKHIKGIFDFFYGKNILRDASKLIANSKAEVNNAKRTVLKDGQIELVYNGIDPMFFNESASSESFKKRFNISNEFILFLGRIDKTKGLDFLVKGFSEFLKDFPNEILLIICGPDGDFRNQLDRIVKELDIKKNIRFIEGIYNEERLMAYSEANIFITTSNYESGVLLTPIEAILCNTPVIVTKKIGEIFKNANMEDFLIDYGDIKGLKEKMKFFIDNNQESKKMVDITRQYIISNLTWNKVVTDMERVYEDCIYHL